MQASGQPGPANVTVNISNTGSAPETLQSLTVANGTATFADAKGATIPGIAIPAGGAVLVGGDGQPTAQLSSVTLSVGGFAPADFAFDKAGKVDVQAQVYSAVGLYASFGPASPSASASAGASASASATGASPAASPSGSASASASTGASASATTSGSPQRFGQHALTCCEARGPRCSLIGRSGALGVLSSRFTARTCSRGRGPSPGSAARPGPARSSPAGA